MKFVASTLKKEEIMDFEKRVEEMKRKFQDKYLKERVCNVYIVNADPDIVSNQDKEVFKVVVAGDLEWVESNKKEYYLSEWTAYPGKKQITAVIAVRPDLKSSITFEKGMMKLAVSTEDRFDIFCRLNLVAADLYYKFMKSFFVKCPSGISFYGSPHLSFSPLEGLVKFRIPKDAVINWKAIGMIKYMGFRCLCGWDIADEHPVIEIEPPSEDVFDE